MKRMGSIVVLLAVIFMLQGCVQNVTYNPEYSYLAVPEDEDEMAIEVVDTEKGEMVESTTLPESEWRMVKVEKKHNRILFGMMALEEEGTYHKPTLWSITQEDGLKQVNQDIIHFHELLSYNGGFLLIGEKEGQGAVQMLDQKGQPDKLITFDGQIGSGAIDEETIYLTLNDKEEHAIISYDLNTKEKKHIVLGNELEASDLTYHDGKIYAVVYDPSLTKLQKEVTTLNYENTKGELLEIQADQFNIVQRQKLDYLPRQIVSGEDELYIYQDKKTNGDSVITVIGPSIDQMNMNLEKNLKSISYQDQKKQLVLATTKEWGVWKGNSDEIKWYQADNKIQSSAN